MRTILAALPAGIRMLEKPLVAEIATLGLRHLLVAPAIPDFGRVTGNGFTQGFGVPRPTAIRGRS